MTVIRPNSISGINSITANGGDINLFRADGTKADIPIVNNITAGIITATSFVGSGTALTGIDAATLKFGNDTKAQAVAGGVNITGNLGVSGVLTYEDVTNVDSVGVITARSGISVTSGSIGINTTGGNEKLNVFGAIRSSGSSANFNAGLEGTLVDYDTVNKVCRVGHVNGTSGSARPLAFLTGGTERLRINQHGTITNTTTSSHSQGAGTFNIKGVINQYSQGSGSGLIFDCDFGRLTGYGDDTNVGNGTNLSGVLAHSTTDWSSNNSNTTISVNGGTFQYRVGFGGYFDAISNGGRVSVGAGSGNPAMSDKLNTAAMTIECWCWYDGDGREVLVSRYGSGFPNQFNMLTDPNGQFHYNNDGVSAGSGNVSGEHFPDKTWHHHLWQYESGVNRWYINGAFANSRSAGSSLAVSSSTGFAIFSRADRLEDFRGKIAIVRIYNRALSAAEIKNHFELERGRFGV